MATPRRNESAARSVGESVMSLGGTDRATETNLERRLVRDNGRAMVLPIIPDAHHRALRSIANADQPHNARKT